MEVMSSTASVRTRTCFSHCSLNKSILSWATLLLGLAARANAALITCNHRMIAIKAPLQDTLSQSISIGWWFSCFLCSFVASRNWFFFFYPRLHFQNSGWAVWRRLVMNFVANQNDDNQALQNDILTTYCTQCFYKTQSKWPFIKRMCCITIPGIILCTACLAVSTWEGESERSLSSS